MPRKTRFWIFLTLSLLCLGAAFGLAYQQMQRYNRSLAYFPMGTTIAGIPVGGLEAQAAGLRLAQAFTNTPVELRIPGSADSGVIQIRPADAGLQLDLDGMLRAAQAALEKHAYWPGFWDYLWNRVPAGFSIPLSCSASGDKISAYLAEQVAPRYGQQAVPAAPVLGDVIFRPGQSGSAPDLAGAVPGIQSALCSLDKRSVEVGSTATEAAPPSVSTLGPALELLTQVSGFDGMIEVYYQDLRSGQEVNFAFNQGHEVPPGIAFTGASTIKIPVMISAYKQVDGDLPAELRHRMELMIDLSDNGSTDEVMQSVLDPNIAPVQVTQDMQALGLKDTFLAGFFYPGAPLLERYQTPANQRADLTTDPDIYNQTSAPDMGRLLAAIQRCADENKGPLLDAFSGKITQAECQEMTGLLKKNRKAVLVEAGLPEGTELAHKYGWVTDSNDGLLHTASDAAIVYTPGGDFVLTVYLYHPAQLQWDNAQRLVARLATAIYNFYNNWR